MPGVAVFDTMSQYISVTHNVYESLAVDLIKLGFEFWWDFDIYYWYKKDYCTDYVTQLPDIVYSIDSFPYYDGEYVDFPVSAVHYMQ